METADATLEMWVEAQINAGRAAPAARNRAVIIKAVAAHAGVSPLELTEQHARDYCVFRGVSGSTWTQYLSRVATWRRFAATGEVVRGGRALREELEGFRRWLQAGAIGRRPLAAVTADHCVAHMSAAARHAGCTPSQLTGARFAAFLAAHPNYTPEYRNAVISSMHRFAAYAAIKDPAETAVLSVYVRKPRKGRPPAQAAVAAMLRIADDRERAVLILGLCAGLRAHEIGMVCAEHIEITDDAGNGRVLVADGKGSHQRYVPMGAAEIAELAPLFTPGRGSGPLFGSWARSGKRNAGRYVTTCVRLLAARAGVACKGHQLRHWYACKVNEHSGGNVLLVKELLGHASLVTTQGYLVELSLQDKGVAVSAGLGAQLRAMRGAA